MVKATLMMDINVHGTGRRLSLGLRDDLTLKLLILYNSYGENNQRKAQGIQISTVSWKHGVKSGDSAYQESDSFQNEEPQMDSMLNVA